ncbi:homoprotocatechuate degradation operon regulator HpaR [bacterium]|jgi:homoprotocatechuate degradation regulator HpaR|nr:homoprotocatechuate degradation operon regulator HpaR [bacterium]
MTSSARAHTAADEAIAMRDFSASLPMALLQAREAAMQLFRPLLAEHDLTEQQWRVLRALSASDEPLEVGAIVDATFLLAPSLSRILKDLDGRNLVRRSPVATDQRRAEISLTEHGYALVASVAPQSEAIYNQIEEAFGDKALQRLLRQLAELRDTTDRIVTSPGDVTIGGTT